MAHPTRHDVSIILQVPAIRKLPVHLCFTSSCCGFITSTVHTVCLYFRGFCYPQTPPRPTLNQVSHPCFRILRIQLRIRQRACNALHPLRSSDSLRPTYFIRSLLDFCRSATLNVVLVTKLALPLHYCSMCLVPITFLTFLSLFFFFKKVFTPSW